jgi:hypothetical protein
MKKLDKIIKKMMPNPYGGYGFFGHSTGEPFIWDIKKQMFSNGYELYKDHACKQVPYLTKDFFKDFFIRKQDPEKYLLFTGDLKDHLGENFSSCYKRNNEIILMVYEKNGTWIWNTKYDGILKNNRYPFVYQLSNKHPGLLERIK